MVKEIQVEELATMLAAGETVYLLDVRQAWENATAALPNSLLIPLNELPHRAGEIQSPEGALVVVYCHHGMRSLRAAAWLQQTGRKDVASLAGGIDAWSLVV